MQPTPTSFLGIDIAKTTFAACVWHAGRHLTGNFDNTPAGFSKLERWLRKHRASQVHACLEATGRYGEALAEHLHAAGHTVSILNPLRLKAFAQVTLTRTKTDPTDAALLAEFCRTQQPAAWTPPPPAQRALRALVRRRADLLELRQAEANRLDSGETGPVVRASLAAVLELLAEQLAEIETAIADQVASDPELQRQVTLIDSIPGMGFITAASLVAEIDFGAYPSARQVAAQAGLTPRQRQSGSSVRGRPHLSKQGSRHLRKILFFPAIVAKRYNPVMRTFAARLAEHDKAPMAIVCACMRKLLHLVYGVLKSGQPFDPNYEAARRQRQTA